MIGISSENKHEDLLSYLDIGGATLIFDTELVAVNGKTSAAEKSSSEDSEL